MRKVSAIREWPVLHQYDDMIIMIEVFFNRIKGFENFAGFTAHPI